MKVLLVYDPLYGNVLGGGEIAFRSIAKALYELLSPDIADIYIPFMVADKVSTKYVQSFKKQGWHLITKQLHLKGAFKYYQLKLHKLYKSFDTSKYDLVFTNGAFLSHTIHVKKPTSKIVYVNTPARAWFNLPYNKAFFRNLLPEWTIDLLNFYYRGVDVNGMYDNTAKVLAISRNVAYRIYSFYNIVADILYPPVQFNLAWSKGIWQALKQSLSLRKPYFVHVSRLEKYKNIDILLEAYSSGKLKHIQTLILGTGRFASYFHKQATKLLGVGEYKQINIAEYKLNLLKFGNLIFLGYVPTVVKNTLVRNAHGSLVLNDEDLGLNKIEALLLGTPYLGCKYMSSLEFADANTEKLLFAPCTASCLVNKLLKYSKQSKINISETYKKRLLMLFSIKNFKLQLKKYLWQIL